MTNEERYKRALEDIRAVFDDEDGDVLQILGIVEEALKERVGKKQ